MFFLKATTFALLNCYFMVTNKVLSVDEMIMYAQRRISQTIKEAQNPTPEELEAITQGHKEFVEEMTALGKII